MDVQHAVEIAAAVIGVFMAHPALLLPLAALTVLVIVSSAPAGRTRSERDPKRMFTSDERRASFELAGWQCEHKHPLWQRCSNSPSQGDHIFPWSKGGWTRMSNLQALCAYHNNRKSGSVPTKAYVWRLERRRRHYYPEHAERKVEWRQGAAR